MGCYSLWQYLHSFSVTLWSSKGAFNEIKLNKVSLTNYNLK